MQSFQEILRKLTLFWEKQGCIIHQGYDLEMGAGTFNPATFLRCLGPEPYRAAYIEPCRRPSDGRFGENPIRMQHYFQYQVILKPSPPDILDLYLKSLEALGFDLTKHDIRFVYDDWEQPTIGAWGLGWEVWMDGMEVTQFTYFQSVAGQELKPVTGEITYGIERLATFLQGVDSTYKLQWSQDVTYGDIYKRSEWEWSHYNFTFANTAMWFSHFDDYEKEAKKLIEHKLPLPAYDFVMKASHAFNMLDARGAISVTERGAYIAKIRDLAKLVAELYIASRQEQNFPLMTRFGNEIEHFAPSVNEWNPPQKDKEDFLLEIGVEELPAPFVPIGLLGLENGIKEFLNKHEIGFTSLRTFATPRRLSILVEDMSLIKEAKIVERKGPGVSQAFDAEGNFLPPGLGFFKSVNVNPPRLEDIYQGKVAGISISSVKGVDHLYAKIEEKRVDTASLLQKELSSIILRIDFPKKMRWGSEEIQFARPIRWVCCLIGDMILPFTLGSIVSDRISQGHRLLDNTSFPIPHAKSYLETLKKHFVLVDIAERKAAILTQLENIEKKTEGKAVAIDKVIPQVLHLVEWPLLTYAPFDSAFLKAPKDLLVSEMVEHQKYFPIEDAHGELKNLFVITANNTPSDLIIQGNQHVLSSRLKDGTFLFEQDLKIPLETFVEKLKSVTYLKGLGSLYDKTERLKRHAKTLLKYLPIAEPNHVERAAYLAKCDLTSSVVYEFPELQGIMGHIYARHHQEDPKIALSIEEHWLPKKEDGPLPKSPLGVIISLADKIDNLLSCFGMLLKPSSSSDPFALRRQVLGMIKILLNNHYRLPLKEVMQECASHFEGLKMSGDELIEEIFQFIQNRIKTVFLDFGLTKDEIESSLSSGFNDIFDIFCRISALSQFRKESKTFPLLLEVYKRAKGQIPLTTLPFEQMLLKQPAEKSLYADFRQVETTVGKAIDAHNYAAAYHDLATLQPSINKLFVEVKILDDDPAIQKNRLALLQQVFSLFGKLVDFSKIK